MGANFGLPCIDVKDKEFAQASQQQFSPSAVVENVVSVEVNAPTLDKSHVEITSDDFDTSPLSPVKVRFRPSTH